jgi:two-component system, response regulator PdtaR
MQILLADDHRRILELTRDLLEPTFDVVRCVEDSESLVEAAGKLQPSVIVTGISMPKLNGIEAASRLRESGCASKIVFQTVHADSDLVQAALNAGALGYGLKLRINSDLLFAIEVAPAGRILVSPLMSAV